MTARKVPFTIHCRDDRGLTVTTHAVEGNPFGVSGVTLGIGDELEVTAEILEWSRDRNGHSWLEDEPTATSRWGLGPCPDDLKAEVRERVKSAAREELSFLMRNNPRLARASNAEKRAAALQDVLDS